MKKQLMMILVLLSFSVATYAQSWDEWFNQKSTQKKYLLEQTAALKVYSGYLKKGYTIAVDGSRLVGDIKNGDFNLHASYFGSLKTVNPAIKKQDKIAHMIALQSEMLLLRQQVIRHAEQALTISNNEKQLIRKRFDDLSAEAAKDIEALELIVTNGKLEMTDDERIARIDMLYQAMTGKYAYQKRLGSSVLAMLRMAAREQTDAALLRALYGQRN